MAVTIKISIRDIWKVSMYIISKLEHFYK